MTRTADVTPCAIVTQTAGPPCREPSHVVLYSQASGEFAGRVYRQGQIVSACITHGGHILDARRTVAASASYDEARTRVAAWLTQDNYLERLPLAKLPEHRRPRPQGKSYGDRRQNSR